MHENVTADPLTPADERAPSRRKRAPRSGLTVAVGVLIVVSALALRVIGTEWDELKHLHPDERYIATVADNIDWPGSVREYLDVENSPLSPYTTEKGRSYLYGTLPLLGTKLVATVLGQEGYGELTRVGRHLSAILDTLTVALVFSITLLVLRDGGWSRVRVGAIFATALYAFAVTAIQHAHFFTTDSWLVFFTTLTLYLALRSVGTDIRRRGGGAAPVIVLVGISLGLTVACKASGVLVALPVGIALGGRFLLARRPSGARSALLALAAEGGAILVSAYVSFRAVSPYTFARSNWLDVSINRDFREALEGQARAVAGETLPPPSYQWLLSSPVWTPLENLAVWQIGIPFAAAALAGLAIALVHIVRNVPATLRESASEHELVAFTRWLALVAFVALVFLYFGTRFVHSGRYLVQIVPTLAVLAGLAVTVLVARRRTLGFVIGGALVAATAVWALAFTSVYRAENTRIAASAWINTHAEPGSVIANEHWDDPLPVGAIWVPEGAGAASVGYQGLIVPVFDPDERGKLHRLYEDLARADYYVLSSPRAWRTIGRLPARFPLMARFYDRLLAGELGFVEAASFSSRPRLLGVSVDDLRAEEAFWVYDHAPVRILRRDGTLDWERFRKALCPQPEPEYCRPST